MTQINILLVDDDVKNLAALEAILNSPEYRLLKASTADETLGILMEQDCAAIVMDVKMPDMSGIELAQLIKQRRKTHLFHADAATGADSACHLRHRRRACRRLRS